MKKRIKLNLVYTALLFGLTSCKDFLDVEPKAYNSDKETITDENSAKTAVRGIYNQLESNDYYGYTFQTIGFFSGDNIEYTGSQIVNKSLTNHDVKADLPALSTSWAAIYNVINRANNVIAKVPDLPVTATFTASVKNQLIGEAYFLRALSYFDLARTWGGVQLILTPTETTHNKPATKRSSLQDTYVRVLEDLKKAEELLPATTNRIRATKKTAWALRARYHLYQKQWADAEKYAGYLIDDKTNYSLSASYSGFFANNVSGTNESVFELYYNVNVTNNQGSQWQPSTRGGVGWIRPTSSVISLLSDAAIGGARNSLIEKIKISGVDNWFGNLYYRTNGTDPAYLIRLSELYLIRAEARAQLENYEEALKDLNAIRKRSNISELKLEDINSKNDLLLAIETENRVEFAFENHRWYDLIRTGRAQTVLGIDDARKLLLPVPYSQILIDKNLEQNPSY